MIKPLNMPQLSSVKARSGLQSIGDLLPRLIRQYELQAELMKRREEQAKASSNFVQAIPAINMEPAVVEQATFGWYE